MENAVDDLRSVESSSPERQENNTLDGQGTQTDFKVVLEVPDEEEEKQSETSAKLKSQTLEENYKETVELVKKYIRVEVPSLTVNQTENQTQRASMTPIADLSMN